MTAGERGHRALPHTADVILEAWGPDLASCCEEAVAALAGTFLDCRGDRVGERSVHIAAGSAESMLLEVLDEVIFTLDTSEEVPVGAEVRPAGDGGLDVVVVLVDPAGVEGTGAVPKAVSRSGLVVEVGPDGAECRFLVDV